MLYLRGVSKALGKMLKVCSVSNFLFGINWILRLLITGSPGTYSTSLVLVTPLLYVSQLCWLDWGSFTYDHLGYLGVGGSRAVWSLLTKEFFVWNFYGRHKWMVLFTKYPSKLKKFSRELRVAFPLVTLQTRTKDKETRFVPRQIDPNSFCQNFHFWVHFLCRLYRWSAKLRLNINFFNLYNFNSIKYFKLTFCQNLCQP